ncbi:hypothetical protein [Micromonospora craterilacus]|nr:hypothetical protein [Micromonospora craterilacus]
MARIFVSAAVVGILLAGCGGQNGSGTSSPGPSESVAAASNGVADLTAEEILTKATAALETARSYQFKGEMGGDDGLMSIDLKVDGEDVAASLVQAGSTIHVLVVDGQPYFKANAKFWKEMAGEEGAGMAKLVGGRWVKVDPDDKAFADLFLLADPREMLAVEGGVVKGESKTIDAGPAIALVSKEDDSTLYVATTGEPRPLLIVGPGNEGEVVISRFGDSFPEIKVPAESEVLDFTEFSSNP